MSLAFLALAVGLLLLPGAAVRVSRRINGHTWLRVTAGSLIAGIVFLEAGLLLAAVPTVFRWLGVTGLADLCQRVAGHLVPGGAAAGSVAAGGSVALPTLLAVSAIRARTRSRRLWHVAGTMGHIQPRDAGREVVTIADPTPFAISVPGRPGRIIITEGLRDLLDDDELEGVIRHEIAHLDERHSILTTFAAGLRGSLRWFRPARRSVAALHLGMERCADSKASAGRSDLRASVRNALLKVAAHPQPLAGMAFASADLVAERLVALSRPHRSSLGLSSLTVTTVAALIAAAGWTLGAWIGHTHHLAVVAPYCPI